MDIDKKILKEEELNDVTGGVSWTTVEFKYAVGDKVNVKFDAYNCYYAGVILNRCLEQMNNYRPCYKIKLNDADLTLILPEDGFNYANKISEGSVIVLGN